MRTNATLLRVQLARKESNARETFEHLDFTKENFDGTDEERWEAFAIWVREQYELGNTPYPPCNYDPDL